MTHEVVSYRTTTRASDAFARLRSAMAHCSSDRAVTVAGTEAVLEVGIVTQPGPKAEPAEEQLTITVTGVYITPGPAGGVMRMPIRALSVVARAANHAVVLQWSAAVLPRSLSSARESGRTAARLMPSLSRIALNRLAAISQGCKPARERVGQFLK